MNIPQKQSPEKTNTPEGNIYVSLAMGIGSVYALWLITSLLIAFLC